jgi:transposase
MPKGKPKKIRVTSSLPTIHLNAAAVDIGSEEHWVAVPADRDKRSVRCFKAFTDDLYALADWLAACHVDTVAMEATGVYWIPLYDILELRGFDVHLVNAKHVQNVTGRKTDILDCQWLQQLHTFGLLSGAFRPDQDILVLRSYVRQRKMLIEYASSHIQHIQKALTQMNLLLHNVVSDVVGATGMAILRDILKGERDPQLLARHRDYRCKASEETIARSLCGSWRAEHLFALRQALELYDTYQTKIHDCDSVIAQQLDRIKKKADRANIPPERTRYKRDRNTPQANFREPLFEIAGVDLSQVAGIQPYTILMFLAETGTDMTPWPNSKRFVSWLGLCPGTKISGGKRLDGRTKRRKSRAASILLIAASTLRSSDSALGAFFRRKAAQFGVPKAVTATAHKLARIIYALLSTRKPFADLGAEAYDLQFRDRTVKRLNRKAQLLGYTLVQLPQSDPSQGAVS